MNTKLLIMLISVAVSLSNILAGNRVDATAIYQQEIELDQTVRYAEYQFSYPANWSVEVTDSPEGVFFESDPDVWDNYYHNQTVINNQMAIQIAGRVIGNRLTKEYSSRDFFVKEYDEDKFDTLVEDNIEGVPVLFSSFTGDSHIEIIFSVNWDKNQIQGLIGRMIAAKNIEHEAQEMLKAILSAAIINLDWNSYTGELEQTIRDGATSISKYSLQDLKFSYPTEWEIAGEGTSFIAATSLPPVSLGYHVLSSMDIVVRFDVYHRGWEFGSKYDPHETVLLAKRRQTGLAYQLEDFDVEASAIEEIEYSDLPAAIFTIKSEQLGLKKSSSLLKIVT